MLPGRGLAGLPGIVTATRADLHASESLGLCLHTDGAIPALRLRLEGLVTNGVLVANVVCYVLRDLVDFMQIAREERDTAGALGKSSQSTLVAFLLGLVVAEDTDGVDNGTVLILHMSNRLLQRHAAGVIFAVGDYQQNFLVELRTFQLRDRRDDGVVHCGATTRIDVLQPFFELYEIVGQWRV